MRNISELLEVNYSRMIRVRVTGVADKVLLNKNKVNKYLENYNL